MTRAKDLEIFVFTIILQNLQVIRPFSYTSQAKLESHESCNNLLTFFSTVTSAFGFTLTVTSLTRRTGMYYFNTINGRRFWLLTCSCHSVIIIALSLYTAWNFNCWNIFTWDVTAEQNVKRLLQDSWLSNFAWLVYENGLMTCKFCKIIIPSMAWNSDFFN
jgi:hypothetical protein